jgi:uncharacterized protein (DUF305 family)
MMGRLSNDKDNLARGSRILLYLAAVLSLAAASIHVWAMPEHFEEWWGYGAFFLGAAVFQGLYGLVLLWRPGSSYFLLGIVANLAIVVLWLVTRTAEIPFFGPHAGEVEAAGAADVAATTVELALVMALVVLWGLSRRPASLLPGGAVDGSVTGAGPLAWRGEQILVLGGVSVIVATSVALMALLIARPPGDGSPEAGFARDMSAHHAQAVGMAEIVRERTESDEVKVLATDIVLTQQAQIGMMQGWLDVWGLSATSTEPAMAWMEHPTEGRMPGMASPEEVIRLRELPPEEADELFLRLMIEHHRAAIPMAEAVLEETDQPAVEELAGAILSSQRAEIGTMQKMLQDMGAPPAEDEKPRSMEGGRGHATGLHGE